ncbi:MAG: hypothetical protein K1Y36_26450 [Blastocatellia bacterium]|nr:hypothetical protein [Blastocatellia bacterium]
MNLHEKTDRLLRSYVLGELSADERRTVQDRYCEDDDFYEQLLVVEDELLDEYVARRLSPTEQTALERNFLTTPARRERLRFAESLAEVAGLSRLEPATQAPKPAEGKRWSWAALVHWLFEPGGWMVPATATGTLLLVAGSLTWLWLQNQSLHRQLGEMQAENLHLKKQQTELKKETDDAKSRADQLAQSLSAPPVHPAEQKPVKPEANAPRLTTLLSLVLVPALNRSEAKGQEFSIPAGIQTIELKFTLRNREALPPYEVEVQTAEGIPVWRKAQLTPGKNGGAVLVCRIPREKLPVGDYVATVAGTPRSIDTEEDYVFRVVK